jgi:hypothetical protein
MLTNFLTLFITAAMLKKFILINKNTRICYYYVRVLRLKLSTRRSINPCGRKLRIIVLDNTTLR